MSSVPRNGFLSSTNIWCLSTIMHICFTFKISWAKINSLLEVIMTIKFGRLFEGIHDKCRILFNNLIPSIEERCMYSDLFLLKNMESLVKEMNSSKDVNLSIKEHLLTSAADMVESLRTDPFGAFCQPQCDLCKPSFAALSSARSVPCGLILFGPLLLFKRWRITYWPLCWVV